MNSSFKGHLQKTVGREMFYPVLGEETEGPPIVISAQAHLEALSGGSFALGTSRGTDNEQSTE